MKIREMLEIKGVTLKDVLEVVNNYELGTNWNNLFSREDFVDALVECIYTNIPVSHMLKILEDNPTCIAFIHFGYSKGDRLPIPVTDKETLLKYIGLVEKELELELELDEEELYNVV